VKKLLNPLRTQVRAVRSGTAVSEAECKITELDDGSAPRITPPRVKTMEPMTQRSSVRDINMVTQINHKTFRTVAVYWKSPPAMDWNREEDKKIGAKYGSSAPVERATGILFGGFPPPHLCARGYPQDQAPAEEQGGSFRDDEL
jgi:hypothetical protein